MESLTSSEIDSIVQEVCDKFNYLNDIVWKYNHRLKSNAGKAFCSQKKIELNPIYFIKASKEEQIETVVHEVCHLIAYHVYGARGHGKVWKDCMRYCGYKPRRCHNYELTGNKVDVVCGCGPRKIGKVRYKRMLAGTKYHCLQCKQDVRVSN